jgi:hypothetical protein
MGLDRLKEFLVQCSTPEESREWIDQAANEQQDPPPFSEVLDAIASEQKDVLDKAVNYSNVESYLRLKRGIRMQEAEIKQLCHALSRMAEGLVFARGKTVEITTRPEKILEAIGATLRKYPAEDRVANGLAPTKED